MKATGQNCAIALAAMFLLATAATMDGQTTADTLQSLLKQQALLVLEGEDGIVRDATALQPVSEHLRDGNRRQRGVAKLAVSDRQRQHLRTCADGA